MTLGAARRWMVFLVVGMLCNVVAVRGEESGKLIYAGKCAECHGTQGTGTDYYPKPLVGDLSANQLAVIIRRTMPEDDPGSLTEAQALAVATHLHGDFYSPIARARNNPPRIELARLTVPQYRRAVGSLFTDAYQVGKERGLKAQYFNHRRYQKQAVEKIDPQIDFEFGNEKPVPEVENPGLYSIRWQGSLLPDDTGTYKIVVRSEQAVRLWLNDNKEALLDGYVKSGDQNEYVADVFLVGGQTYPIKLEFARSNQGVSDEKQHKRHEKLQSASVALLWQPPGRLLQTIPERHLSPAWSPARFVCGTSFPPDDRSYGWERGTSISPSWDTATTAAAVEAAEYVRLNVDQLLKNIEGENREAKLRSFCESFVAKAFREPLSERARQSYIAANFAATENPDQAVRRVVLMTLKSPRFLYRELGSENEAANTASRLAFALTNSSPDKPLRAAVERGDLYEPLLREHSASLALSKQGQAKLRQFLLNWLGVAGEVDLVKASDEFPGFDEQAIDQLRTSLELGIDAIVAQPSADYRRLFAGSEYYLSPKLAELYGSKPVESGFVRQPLDNTPRAGLVTHPYVLARFAHADSSSPIHRGVFLVRSVLGQTLTPPPEAVAPLAADLHPELTTRERVALQTKDRACMVCHNVINPLGFTLERFDAIGKSRDTDNGKPIDDTGFFQPRSGNIVEFDGPGELSAFLTESEQASRAFVQHLFHFLVQQSIQAYGPEMHDRLHNQFVDSDYNVRKLAVEIAVATSPIGRDADAQSVADRQAKK